MVQYKAVQMFLRTLYAHYMNTYLDLNKERLGLQQCLEVQVGNGILGISAASKVSRNL